MKSIKHFILLSTAVAACNSSENQNSKKNTIDSKQPNVVLFFTDDNAHWYWGFSGGPDLSPTIDQLAKEGLVCTQFYASAPVCTPSRYNLHTGKYAGRCKHNFFLEDNPVEQPYRITWNTFLNGEHETTMGELFQSGGYQTGFVGKWHLGGENEEKYGFKKDDDPQNPKVDKKLKQYQQDIIEHIKKTGYDYAASITPANNDWHTVEAVNVHNLEWYAKGAIDFIKEKRDKNKPFFLIVNITTHHGPCHRYALDEAPINLTQAGFIDGLEGIMPPRKTVKQRIEEKNYPYDFKTSGTVWTDDCVKAILDELKAEGIYKNTLTIFTSNHNRAEDGKGTCYNAGSHIPCLVTFPNVLQSGKHFNEQWQITDIMPTCMEACNIPIPENLKIDGMSMWPYLKGDLFNLKRQLFIEFGYGRAIIDGKWKYIALRYTDEKIKEMKSGKTEIAYNIQGNITDAENAILKYQHYFDPDQLYHLQYDPGEEINLAYENDKQEQLKIMQEKLKAITSTFEHPFPIDNKEPFFYTNRYKEMQQNARNNMNFENHYWYVGECY